MKLISPIPRSERGTQIAEFAVALPLLLFLVLLVTEGAGLVRAHQALNNIAREGARASGQDASPLNGDQTDAVIAAMSSYANNNGLPFPSSPNTCAAGKKAPCFTETNGTATDCTGNGSVLTYCKVYTYALDKNATPTAGTCSSVTVVVEQDITVLTGDATVPAFQASRISLSCGWPLQLLPKLGFGMFSISNNLGLRGTSTFRNFYQLP